MFPVSKLELAGIALVALTLTHGAVYLKGRHDDRKALKAEQLKANITGITATVSNLQKTEAHYEPIFQEIHAVPSVGKKCPLPPAFAAALDRLPDADRD